MKLSLFSRKAGIRLCVRCTKSSPEIRWPHVFSPAGRAASAVRQTHRQLQFPQGLHRSDVSFRGARLQRPRPKCLRARARSNKGYRATLARNFPLRIEIETAVWSLLTQSGVRNHTSLPRSRISLPPVGVLSRGGWFCMSRRKPPARVSRKAIAIQERASGWAAQPIHRRRWVKAATPELVPAPVAPTGSIRLVNACRSGNGARRSSDPSFAGQTTASCMEGLQGQASSIRSLAMSSPVRRRRERSDGLTAVRHSRRRAHCFPGTDPTWRGCSTAPQRCGACHGGRQKPGPGKATP